MVIIDRTAQHGYSIEQTDSGIALAAGKGTQAILTPEQAREVLDSDDGSVVEGQYVTRRGEEGEGLYLRRDDSTGQGDLMLFVADDDGRGAHLVNVFADDLDEAIAATA